MTPEEIIFSINPLIKGKINVLSTGSLFFGRMWLDYEKDFIRSEINSKKIDFIWNLLEKSHGNIDNSIEIHSPIEDFGVPLNKVEFIKDTEFILNQIKNGKNVLVHCFGGKGRTSLALAILLTKSGMNVKDSLSLVMKIVKGPETNEQKEFVIKNSGEWSG